MEFPKANQKFYPSVVMKYCWSYILETFWNSFSCYIVIPHVRFKAPILPSPIRPHKEGEENNKKALERIAYYNNWQSTAELFNRFVVSICSRAQTDCCLVMPVFLS